MNATTLMTLTCNPARHPHVDDAFARTSLAVNQLFKRIRRRWPDSRIEYFLVWERTKKGWPHAHLLLRAPFIPQGWLSGVWNELTGAPIVDIRAVHTPGEVVAYIAKYLSKDPRAPVGMKRYRSSRRFFNAVLPHHGADDVKVRYWRVMHDPADVVARDLSQSGMPVKAHPDGSFTAFPPSHPGARSPSVTLSDRRFTPSLAL